MKLTKNSIKRKVKSSINPFYGKRGPSAKAGRAAIKAGSGCISGTFQLMWLMIYWTFYGSWLLLKWLFYTLPKLLIEKYKALTPIKKQVTKIILIPIFIIPLVGVAINYVSSKEYGEFVISLVLVAGLGIWLYFSIKKLIELKKGSKEELENIEVQHSSEIESKKSE